MEVNAVGSKQEAFVNNAKKYIGQGPAKFRKWFYGSDKKIFLGVRYLFHM